jgi:hypothetical protein
MRAAALLVYLAGSAAIKCNTGDRGTYNGVESVHLEEAVVSCPSEANACLAYSYSLTVGGNEARTAIGECSTTARSCDMVLDEIEDLIIELYPWIRPQYRKLSTGCIVCEENGCNDLVYFTNAASKATPAVSIMVAFLHFIALLFT